MRDEIPADVLEKARADWVEATFAVIPGGIISNIEVTAKGIAAERSAAIAFAEQMAESCDAQAAAYDKKDRLKAQASSAQAHVLRQFARLFATRHVTPS